MFEIGGKNIPSTLTELVDPKRAALLIWDMENAIGPNAFNYKDILANLQQLPRRRGRWVCRFFIRSRLPSTLRRRKPASGCG